MFLFDALIIVENNCFGNNRKSVGISTAFFKLSSTIASSLDCYRFATILRSSNTAKELQADVLWLEGEHSFSSQLNDDAEPAATERCVVHTCLPVCAYKRNEKHCCLHRCVHLE